MVERGEPGVLHVKENAPTARSAAASLVRSRRLAKSNPFFNRVNNLENPARCHLEHLLGAMASGRRS
jgi:hypothetical protein